MHSVAAAGVIVDKPFLEHTPKDLDMNLNVNVSAVDKSPPRPFSTCSSLSHEKSRRSRRFHFFRPRMQVKGVFYAVQHCAKKMKEQGTGGSIVAIASTASYKSPAAHAISAYTASKYAVRGFMGQITKEMAKYDIRVNTVSPGYVFLFDHSLIQLGGFCLSSWSLCLLR